MINVVVMGEGSVGKSSLVIRFVRRMFVSKYEPTVEDRYERQVVLGDEVVLLRILDTAGAEEFSQIRDTYIIEGEVFLVAFAINSASSFLGCERFIQQIQRTHERKRVALALVGTKADLAGAREVSRAEAERFAQRHGAPYIETSSKDGANVDEAFTRAAQLFADGQRAAATKRRCAVL
eukprot:gnl/Chilomastix_cuspidata/3255.p3 GENE.gnl/Chilomastix_cuspidata/3255~~gnl/Chilomastix_cuspidata/3255.p3  ORF type:complete len:189 (-),score=97.86 gnl/Chilomastix_cuspidata/3255:977-1513(-)